MGAYISNTYVSDSMRSMLLGAVSSVLPMSASIDSGSVPVNASSLSSLLSGISFYVVSGCVLLDCLRFAALVALLLVNTISLLRIFPQPILDTLQTVSNGTSVNTTCFFKHGTNP